MKKLRVAAALLLAYSASILLAQTPVAGPRKELGLRLEKQLRSVPALILDHIEQTPTEN